MMPSSSSSSPSSSSSSASVRVEKATSDLLIGPDWTMNMEICDSINANHWLAKDVVKAVKKRLQHKSSTVQQLTLTLLETMVKNCGDYVHFLIVDRNILQDLVKMVKKKADTKVRTKILVLLDSWQEAFGGQGGKYPQYFWTYEELRRSGVQFPRRSPDAVPVFTPPVTHPHAKPTQPSSSWPSNSSTSKRLDEAMASEMVSLSLPGLDAMGRVAELLTEMLRAVNPGDQEAVKDELIVDLVDQCRSNQKRLMQMLTSTGDEELLARGLELNDNLQSVLANHDAIASGVPLPVNNEIADTSLQAGAAVASNSQVPNKELEIEPNVGSIVPAGPAASSNVDEVEDDFSLLARRHAKPQNSETPNTENQLSTTTSTAHESTEATATPNNALVLADPQPPTRITNEQDMIDFLSLALTTTSVESPASPAHETPVSPTTQVQPTGFQIYPGQATYNNYVAPWALPQSQPQPQPQPQAQAHLQQFHQLQPQLQPQTHPQQVHQPQLQLQPHTQPQQFHLSRSQPQPQTQPQQFHRQNSFENQNGVPLPTQHQPFQSAQLQYPQHQQYPQTRPSQLPGSPQQHQQPAFYTQNVQSQARPQTPFQQQQMPSSPQYAQYSPTYIPPPWAATPGYYSNQRPVFSNNSPQNYGYSTYGPTQPSRPQQYNIGSNVQNDHRMSSSSMTTAPAAGQKPFIPSYRLFEDLDVFKQADGRVKDTSTSGSPSLSGGPGQGMVSRNK